MSLDLSYDYDAAKKKIAATSTYKDLKTKIDKLQKRAGDSQEEAIDQLQQGLNQVKDQTKRFQKEIKNQFEQLLDINNVTGGKGSNSIAYIKRLLIQTLKNIEPKIAALLNEESLKAVGCDQQQTYTPNTDPNSPLYVKVGSIDLGSLLKKSPSDLPGKLLYEKLFINVQNYPFSMNRELYQRIQSGQPYSFDNGSFYLGKSGQPLFDIQFEETNIFGQSGGWYRITLANRVNGVNKVGDFLLDYFGSIRIFDFETVLPAILEALCGAISISANVGLTQAENATKFELLIQRILGLCFDNAQEIDVQGTAKLAELDGIDQSFFEFTDLDLRKIQQKIDNIKKGVVSFVECDNVDLPVDAESVINALDNLRFVPDEDLVDAADKITETLVNNPAWSSLVLTGNIKAAVDLNFVKLIVQGLVFSILTPKVLLPIFIMLKSLGKVVVDQINSWVDFVNQFRRFTIDLISKIGALFVEELFNLIKKDILNLLQTVIKDLAREKADKRIIMIIKLIQILIVIAQFIADFRKCKSVIDEILWLLKIALSGWGGEIPLPLLAASQLLDGYSETRAFISTLEELQKLGIPTGDLPDGSPNLGIASILSQMKAQAVENAENGKTQIFIPPLAVVAGVTTPTTGFGKSY
jgi:hypothetical protein